MKLYRYIAVLAVLLVNTGEVTAKPRTVYLDKELKNAMYIDFVKVINYTDSTILFQEIENHTGYYSSEWFNTQNFALKAKSNTAYLSAEIRKADAGSEKYTTGYIPQIGEEVLIVVNKENKVSLFANLTGSVYRFWSPYFTGSSALFYFKEPASKLENEDGPTDVSGEYMTCWDGCLLPGENLLTYSYREDTAVFKGTAQMNAGHALFIWEFADSEAFFLNGIDVWDEKYLNKTLTLKGILIQFADGKSMIFDWDIISIEK